MNKPRRYAIKQTKLNWQILDFERLGAFAIVAECRTLEDAQLVCNALNFNHRPYEYGYRLVD